MFCIRDTSLEIPRILCRAALDIDGYILINLNVKMMAALASAMIPHSSINQTINQTHPLMPPRPEKLKMF